MTCWEVYRCDFADKDDAQDRACGIREVDETSSVARMVVSDTAHDECCHHMRLDDAQHIVDLHNLATSAVVSLKSDVPPDQFEEFRKNWLSAGRSTRPVLLDVEKQRDYRQATVGVWAIAAFGREEALSVPQRAFRLLEESVEMAQACDVDVQKVHELVTYVYGRPKGEIAQELGGVGVTLLALAQAVRLSADLREQDEVERVLSKPTSYYAERNAAKNAAGMKVT